MSNSFDDFKNKLLTPPVVRNPPLIPRIAPNGLPVLMAGHQTRSVITERVKGEKREGFKSGDQSVDEIVPRAFDEDFFRIIKSFNFKKVDGVPICTIEKVDHTATEVLRYNSDRLVDLIKSGKIFEMPKFRGKKVIAITYVFIVMVHFDEDRKTIEEVYDEVNNEIISPVHHLSLGCAAYDTSKGPESLEDLDWDFHSPIPTAVN